MIAMKKRRRNEMKNVVQGIEGKMNHKNQINHSSDN
jgi:hypothetical protein